MTIEELRNSLSTKELELLDQTKQLNENNNQLSELNARIEQIILEKDKQINEQRHLFEKLSVEHENLRTEFENVLFYILLLNF